MKQFETKKRYTVEDERELVNKIEDEIAYRKNETDIIRRLPTDMPGNYLVQLAGELSLCASGISLYTYSIDLWPDIRSSIGSLDDLTTGNYNYAIQKTREVFDKRSSQESEKGFTLMAAYSRTTNYDAEVRDALTLLFIMRLDAGFFLAGLKTLFPEEQASSIVREVYNRCSLSQWDEILTESREVLDDYAALLREIITSTPARLDGDEFRVLMRLLKSEENPNLALVLFEEEMENDGNVWPWQIMAVDNYFKQFFPDEMESGEIIIRLDEFDHSLHIHHKDRDQYIAIFTSESIDEIDIPIPADIQAAGKINGFCFFEAISRQISISDENDNAMLIQFLGWLPLENLVNAGLELVPGSVARIRKSQIHKGFPVF